MIRIYHVEDSEIVRDQLRQALSAIPGIQLAGFAAGAPEACRQISLHIPDVVILDLQLEEGTGWDVVNCIKTKALPVRVIILSSLASQPFRDRAAQLGLSEFFDKFTESDQFLKTIEDLAASRTTKPR